MHPAGDDGLREVKLDDLRRRRHARYTGPAQRSMSPVTVGAAMASRPTAMKAAGIVDTAMVKAVMEAIVKTATKESGEADGAVRVRTVTVGPPIVPVRVVIRPTCIAVLRHGHDAVRRPRGRRSGRPRSTECIRPVGGVGRRRCGLRALSRSSAARRCRRRCGRRTGHERIGVRRDRLVCTTTYRCAAQCRNDHANMTATHMRLVCAARSPEIIRAAAVSST